VCFDLAGVPTTYLLTPFHWEAWVSGLGARQLGPDGVLTMAMPLGDALLPGIAAEDIGRCAYGVFCAGEKGTVALSHRARPAQLIFLLAALPTSPESSSWVVEAPKRDAMSWVECRWSAGFRRDVRGSAQCNSAGEGGARHSVAACFSSTSGDKI